MLYYYFLEKKYSNKTASLLTKTKKNVRSFMVMWCHFQNHMKPT